MLADIVAKTMKQRMSPAGPAAAAGRNGDQILAHISPKEAELLKQLGGSGTINPQTGVMEFWGDWDGWSADYGNNGNGTNSSFADAIGGNAYGGFGLEGVTGGGSTTGASSGGGSAYGGGTNGSTSYDNSGANNGGTSSYGEAMGNTAAGGFGLEGVTGSGGTANGGSSYGGGGGGDYNASQGTPGGFEVPGNSGFGGFGTAIGDSSIGGISTGINTSTGDGALSGAPAGGVSPGTSTDAGQAATVDVPATAPSPFGLGGWSPFGRQKDNNSVTVGGGSATPAGGSVSVGNTPASTFGFGAGMSQAKGRGYAEPTGQALGVWGAQAPFASTVPGKSTMAQPFTPGTPIADAAARAYAAFPDLPKGYLEGMYGVETRYGTLADRKGSAFSGPLQQSKDNMETWGMPGSRDPKNPYDATMAAAREFIGAQNLAGRQLSPAEGYAAHQQGAFGMSGAFKDLTAPIRDYIAADNVRANHRDPNMTVQDFINSWASPFFDPRTDYANPAGSVPGIDSAMWR